MSKHMMPVAHDTIIDHLLENGPDQTAKFAYMNGSLPKINHLSSTWHGKGFLHSSSWYSPCPWARHSMDVSDGTNGFFMYGLEPSMARSYMDHYWRDHAVKVSNSNFGLVLPGHENRDLLGWKAIFPDAKIVSVENYETLQALFVKYKTKSGNDEIIRYYEADRSVYEPTGYIVDLPKFLNDITVFHTSMKDVFEYLGFDDFIECYPALQQYWKAYRQANQRLIEP